MLLLIIQEKIKEPVIKEQIARLRPVHEAYRNVMDLIRLHIGCHYIKIIPTAHSSFRGFYQKRLNMQI